MDLWVFEDLRLGGMTKEWESFGKGRCLLLPCVHVAVLLRPLFSFRSQ
jgi:hypothetical protein